MNLKIAVCAAAAAALVLPAAASAQDFCVNAPPGCNGVAIGTITLQSWLTVAQTNGTDDRFFIAPGTLTGGPWTYSSGEALQIVGAGADKTTLVSTLAGPVLSLGSNPDVGVSHLAVRADGAANVGLALNGAHASDVTVTSTPQAGGLAMVQMTGAAALDHSRASSSGGNAVNVLSGSPTISDSSISSPDAAGVASAGTQTTLAHDRIAAEMGIAAIAGQTSVSDTLIDLRGMPVPAVGAYAAPQGASTAALHVDRVTIVGDHPDTAERIGLYSATNGPGATATVTATNTVVGDVGVPVARIASAGSVANLTASHDAYGGSVVANQQGAGTLAEDHVIAAAPRLADPAGGDFTPRADSPLVDAGLAEPLPASAVDAAGAPRLTDGNGDCTATVDIGAFERPAAPATCAPAGPAPAAPALPPAAPAGPAALPRIVAPSIAGLRVALRHGRPVAVRLTLSAPATVQLRVTARHRRTRRLTVHAGAGAQRIALRLRLAPGRYSISAVATGATGLRSRRATARFRVARG
jgi:hypothetical protein